MKKLLLLLGVLLITTGSAFALSSPRWSFFPVNVYIQHDGKNAANAQIVQNAFKTWQSNSNYILKFLYKNSSGYAKNAQIRVKFADNIPEGGYYYINDMTMSKSFRNQYVKVSLFVTTLSRVEPFERKTGLEPATPTLARSCSTN